MKNKPIIIAISNDHNTIWVKCSSIVEFDKLPLQIEFGPIGGAKVVRLTGTKMLYDRVSLDRKGAIYLKR